MTLPQPNEELEWDKLVFSNNARECRRSIYVVPLGISSAAMLGELSLPQLESAGRPKLVLIAVAGTFPRQSGPKRHRRRVSCPTTCAHAGGVGYQ